MDATDRAIIDVLRQDGRISNVALADRVNLTPGPCLRRVQKLEADGVIVGYRAEVDPAAVGQGFEILLDVELTNFDRGSVDRFEGTMAGYDEVLELYRMFGAPDYFIRVAVADLPAYEAFLTDRVMTIPGVLKVSSRFPMKRIKSLRGASDAS
ncbi:Lrp/AsnC family transcriptional regulator [Agromyces mariniharenae]|uniref:Lrp/AsnC family transcriptional regulator n=1 Tax=Agromyces mariniharenae TaxID=2604423 RepID=A0A5S4V2S6_9MICO|nr:Lrp/AsnC family transcriptional regulator [Agromyces mariniharenae]TYL53302.1 Lrp/AsnC family transcriptional regulator [Agromyces mariniharenae]